MAYTSQELELISTATELLGQEDLREQSKAFLSRFPENLGSAKQYFEGFLEYQQLMGDYYNNLSPKDQKEQAKKYAEDLQKIETKMKSAFAQSDNDPDSDLKSYLQAHFELKCQLTKDNQLSFKEGRGVKELQMTRVELRMQALAESGFSPAQILRSESPSKTREVQIQAYMEGSKAGNLECKIRLADAYLNARVQGEDATKFGLMEEEAIKIMKKGLAKSNPTAISSVSTFLDNYMKAAPFLYSDQSPVKDLETISENGKLAMALCSDKKINKNIKSILEMGRTDTPPHYSPNADKLKESKVLRNDILEYLPTFAGGLKMNNEKAANMAGKLATGAAEVRTRQIVQQAANILINGLDRQIAIYQKKNQNDNALPLQNARKELVILSSDFSLRVVPQKLKKFQEVLSNIGDEVKNLQPTNPLKRLVNAIAKKLFNKEPIFKAKAQEAFVQSKKMLFVYSKKTESQPKLREQTVESTLKVAPPTLSLGSGKPQI